MFTACTVTTQPFRGSAPATARRIGALTLLSAAALAAASTAAAGQPKADPPQASAAVDPVAEPVERLIIQYKTTLKTDRAVSASVSDDKVTAAAQVARSAGLARASGLRYLRSVAPQLHVARLDQTLPAEQAQALVESLRADPAVAAVEVDHRVRAHELPTDPYFTNPNTDHPQWHLQTSEQVAGAINAPAAWASSTGSGVVVAVLDGGYRPHRDLRNNLITPGYDFVRADDDGGFWNANDGGGLDDDAMDPGDWIAVADASLCTLEEPGPSTWHGTHVAGLVAAVANGSEGVGVAYGARVLPVRVLGRCGGYMSDVLAGARWAVGLSTDVGVARPPAVAKVLNLSLGVAVPCDRITQSVVDEIRARGVSIVASTGNDYKTAITAPANCRGVVAVTAHNRAGTNADYANVGAGVDISAPGGEELDAVMSTWNDGRRVPGNDVYGGLRGTSMATPQVAAVLALMASARPDLPMASLETLMLGAARSFPPGDYCVDHPGECGSGLLDAGAAVQAALVAPVPEAPVTAAAGDSGGGCSVAPPGSGGDAGLPLLLTLALAVGLWRRVQRRAARAVQRPPVTSAS